MLIVLRLTVWMEESLAGQIVPTLSLEELEIQQVLDMYELMPDVLFWIKDRDSRLVHANQAYLIHFGFQSVAQVKGKTDYAFAPAYLARQYLADDQKIIGGELVTERLEMNLMPGGELAWYITSKRPVKTASGLVIGSFGITRQHRSSAKIEASIEAIKGPVEYILQNYSQEIYVDKLADIAHLSISALERRFRKYLRKSPKQFINEVRLENARRLVLNSRLTIADIAYQCGFNDSSYFSRQFKLAFHILPSQLRDSMSE